MCPQACPQAGGKMQNDTQKYFEDWTYTLREAGLIIGLIRYAKPVITYDHANRAVMKQLCEIKATF